RRVRCDLIGEARHRDRTRDVGRVARVPAVAGLERSVVRVEARDRARRVARGEDGDRIDAERLGVATEIANRGLRVPLRLLDAPRQLGEVELGTGPDAIVDGDPDIAAASSGVADLVAFALVARREVATVDVDDRRSVGLAVPRRLVDVQL